MDVDVGAPVDDEDGEPSAKRPRTNGLDSDDE